MGEQQRWMGTRRGFLRLMGLGLGAGIAAPLEARCIEPYALDISRHEVPLPDLPSGLDGFSVAHLTDLHRGPVTPNDALAKAIAATQALQPDVVVITGDFVHHHARDAAPLAKMLSVLKPRLGLWGSLGNHDYGSSAPAVSQALEAGCGLRMLRNDAAEVAPGLWIAGLDDTVRGTPDTPAIFAKIPAGAPAIFLTHNPVGVFAVDTRPWLVLAGHTHGGQIRLPGLPPRFPPGMEGFPYIAGWGVFDRARLYINRGVGMGMLPVRFRCRPEIALFTLRRGDGPPVTRPDLAVRIFRRAGRVAKSALSRLRQV